MCVCEHVHKERNVDLRELIEIELTLIIISLMLYINMQE